MLVLSLRGERPKPIGLHSNWKLMVLHEWRGKWTALFSWSRAQILPPEPCVDCVGHWGTWEGTEWNDTWAWKWGGKALFFHRVRHRLCWSSTGAGGGDLWDPGDRTERALSRESSSPLSRESSEPCTGTSPGSVWANENGVFGKGCLPLKGGITIPPPTTPIWGLKVLAKRKEERVRESEHEMLWAQRRNEFRRKERSHPRTYRHTHAPSEHKGSFKCTTHFVEIYMLHSNEYQLWQHNGLLEILCLQDQFFWYCDGTWIFFP